MPPTKRIKRSLVKKRPKPVRKAGKRRPVSTTPSIRPVRPPIGLKKRSLKRPSVKAPKNQSGLVKKIDKVDKKLRFKKRLLKQVFV